MPHSTTESSRYFPIARNRSPHWPGNLFPVDGFHMTVRPFDMMSWAGGR